MKAYSRILRYILRYKTLVVLAVFCSLIYASMNGFSAYLIGPFMKTIFFQNEVVSGDKVNQPQDLKVLEKIKYSLKAKVDEILGKGNPKDVLSRLCLLVLVVIFFKNIFSYMQGYIMAYVEQGVVRNLREDVYESYHRLPLYYFQERKTGDLISRVINDCNTVNTNLNSSLINLMKEPINIFVLLSLMIVISWQLALISFLVAPPILFVISRISKKLRRRTTHTQGRVSAITSVLEETISNIRVVKAFAMEPFEINKFKKANYKYFRSLLRLFRIRRLSSPVTEFLGVTIAVGVLWIGGRMVIDQRGILAPEEFIVFILLLISLMQGAKRLSEVNNKIQMGIAATGRVFEIIDQPSDIADPPHPRPIDRICDSIRFCNVWYEYNPDEPVLKGINMEVKVGENIAIVGPSGAGKSTLVDLLPRFFDPVSGSVEIDGVDIREHRLDDLRKNFGIVTQETILFHDTIRDNIAYGRPDILFEDIVEAAKTAFAHDFIMNFENGYDTIIGDRGTKLSGGQKQ
ncbi:MAG: ABC transporter ATP-binding protein, partial [Candidatus Latescibacteria bacterium]|nr:ABC transporter ATP-binding protein [Candidatus Latescibacterota bacterium]